MVESQKWVCGLSMSVWVMLWFISSKKWARLAKVYNCTHYLYSLIAKLRILAKLSSHYYQFSSRPSSRPPTRQEKYKEQAELSSAKLSKNKGDSILAVNSCQTLPSKLLNLTQLAPSTLNKTLFNIFLKFKLGKTFNLGSLTNNLEFDWIFWQAELSWAKPRRV